MAKRRHNRRHRPAHNRVHRIRRSNPAVYFARPRRRRHAHRHNYRINRHHYRRNPAILGMSVGEVAVMTTAGVLNGIATRSLPQMVLGSNNSGAVGYLANAGTAFVGALVAKWIGGQRAAVGAVVGGGTALVQRIVSDLMGSKLGDLNLSGDLDFDLGFYIGNSFPLPTAGSGPYLLNPGYTGTPEPSVSIAAPTIVPAALPAAAAGATAAAASAPAGTSAHHGMSGARWGSRWAA